MDFFREEFGRGLSIGRKISKDYSYVVGRKGLYWGVLRGVGFSIVVFKVVFFLSGFRRCILGSRMVRFYLLLKYFMFFECFFCFRFIRYWRFFRMFKM